jgi:hypothetical protein
MTVANALLQQWSTEPGLAVRIASSTAPSPAPDEAQRVDRERGQPFYLGGELRRDLLVEPPFRPPSSRPVW